MLLTLRIFLADVRALLRSEPDPKVGLLGKTNAKKRPLIRVLCQMVISLAVIAVTIGVILDAKQPETMKKTMCTLFGTVVGYWLR